jgi:hypothetical protein
VGQPILERAPRLGRLTGPCFPAALVIARGAPRINLAMTSHVHLEDRRATVGRLEYISRSVTIEDQNDSAMLRSRTTTPFSITA